MCESINITAFLFNMEIWKDIKNYEGIYQISNYGRVKSLRFGKEKILKPAKMGNINNQYYGIYLCVNSKMKMYKIHRLVAIYFIENPYNLPTVNHINRNHFDNSIKNLEWVSNRDNISHRVITDYLNKKYVGINFCKRDKKWIAKIYNNNKQIYIGRAENEYDAYLLRQKYLNENKINSKYV